MSSIFATLQDGGHISAAQQKVMITESIDETSGIQSEVCMRNSPLIILILRGVSGGPYDLRLVVASVGECSGWVLAPAQYEVEDAARAAVFDDCGLVLRPSSL